MRMREQSLSRGASHGSETPLSELVYRVTLAFTIRIVVIDYPYYSFFFVEYNLEICKFKERNPLACHIPQQTFVEIIHEA